MGKTYRNLVFTTHASERLGDRSISQHAVYETIQNPDQKFPAKKGKTDGTKFIRILNQRKYHVVAEYLPDERKWLVISVWVRGEEDKISLVWQAITAPFKLLWWVGKTIFTAIKK